MSKKKITQNRLKEVLSYTHETGIFIWKDYMSSTAQAGSVAGHKNTRGYVAIKVDHNLYYAHRLAWLYVHGYFPENEIDHINRIRHHNWILNLREVSHRCNLRNTGNQKDNTSGVKGVRWDKRYNKWTAQISVNGYNRSLGHHDDFCEAVCSRLAGEQCLNWSGCDSNSPAFKYVTNMLKGVKNDIN